MEPALLGLAAPSIASAAGNVGRAVSTVARPLVSPFATLLQRLHGNRPSLAAETPQGVTHQSLGARAEQLQADVERRISRALESSGIEIEQPLRLSVSEWDGSLEVSTISPQREVLEAALASDPDLAADFRELAAIRGLLAAIDDHKQFAQEYADDPQRAIADRAWLINDRFEAQLSISEEHGQAVLTFK